MTAAISAIRPTTGIAAPMTGANSRATKRATVHRTSSATTIAASAIHVRRTIRRSHSRRRCGTRPDRIARSVGSSGPSIALRGSGGTREPARPRGGAKHGRESGAHQAPLRGRRNRSRQRRVGETSWTDTAIRIADRMSHEATLRGQKALRATPNCCTGITSAVTASVPLPTAGPPTAATSTAGTGAGPPGGTSENTTTASLPVSSPASRAQYEPYVVWVGADHVGHGEERVEIGDRLGRPSLDRPEAAGRLAEAGLGHGAPEHEDEDRAKGDGHHPERRDDRRGLRPLHERRAEQPERPEPERGGEQHDVAADDVVGADATEHEDDGGHRHRRGDQDEDIGERAEQLAEHDRERGDRRRDEQIEGLLFALEADRTGRERGRQQHDEQRDDHHQASEQLLADGRGRIGRGPATRCAVALLEDQFVHPREETQEHEVQGQDDERPPSAHPAAELLDADRRQPAEQAAERTDRVRPAHGWSGGRATRFSCGRGDALGLGAIGGRSSMVGPGTSGAGPSITSSIGRSVTPRPPARGPPR